MFLRVCVRVVVFYVFVLMRGFNMRGFVLVPISVLLLRVFCVRFIVCVRVCV